jgi:glycosyltransferase involved in cell wall biosynthesis
MDMLRQESDVEIFWDESWRNGPRVNISRLGERGFDTLVLFQLIDRYTAAELKGSGCKNIILIPMYDQSGGWSDLYWLQYRDFKVINFSKALHDKLQRLGMQSKYFQYYLPPATAGSSDAGMNDGLHGFFWQRTDGITWDHIRRLIEGTDFRSFHLHLAVDPPGYEKVMPTDEEIRKYNITASEWFHDREDYFRVASRANVFFAPRLYEGIGMSFVEAIAQGKFIVAPDYPTMNEYIAHGVNGLLYNPYELRPLKFPPVDALASLVRQYAVEGYSRWCGQRTELMSYLFSDSQRKRFWSFFPTIAVTALSHVAARLKRKIR